MSGKWFINFRMLLSCAAFGFAMAVGLQDAHAVYIEQMSPPPGMADNDYTRAYNYNFISLENVAVSKPLQSLDLEMESRTISAISFPVLIGQAGNNPLNFSNLFRLQIDDEKQLSRINIPDMQAELAPFVNVRKRRAAREQGHSPFAEQSAYMDSYVIDFVNSIAHKNDIEFRSIYRSVNTAAHSLNNSAPFLFDSGLSRTGDDSYRVLSNPPEVIEPTIIRKILVWLLNSFYNGSLFMYFIPFCAFTLLIFRLKSLLEKFANRRL